MAGSYSYPIAQNFPLLMKLTESGATALYYWYSMNPSVTLRSVVQTSDSTLMLAGLVALSSTRMFAMGTRVTHETTWTLSYSASQDSSYSLCGVATAEGGAILAGRLSQNGHYGAGLFQVSAGGALTGTSFLDADSSFEAAALQRTSDGGLILAGTWGAGDGRDMYVVRMDAQLIPLWRRHFGGDLADGATAVLQLPTGAFIVAGWTRSSGNGPSDGVLAQLSSSGDVQWMQTIGEGGDDVLTALAPAPDGGFYTAGYGQGSDSSLNLHLMRFPPGSGIVGTVRDLTTNLPVSGACISVAGTADSVLSDSTGHYVFRVLPGTYDFVVGGRCVARDTLRDINVLPDSVMALDVTARLPHGRVVESSLNPVVHNHVVSTVPLYVHNDGPGVLDFSAGAQSLHPAGTWLTVTPERGSVAAGDSFALQIGIDVDTSDTGLPDYLGSISVAMNSCPDTLHRVSIAVTVLSSDASPQAVATKYDLSVYPNPFNAQTALSLSLPQRTLVSLVLYDVTGRVVRTLCDGVREAGVQRFEVDGSALPSGLYFARVETPAYSRTHKLVLLK
ncbi:MAG TPA: T9SS type A sorting domain-containing protein [bacterium]